MLLVANNLYRGPRPTDLTILQTAGIKRIISLESGVQDLVHPDQSIERQFPCEFGIAQYDMKSSDFTPPEDWVVHKVIALMVDQIPTYIHCKSGVDRTGFVCAAYRMQVQHWTFEAAHEEWIALGRHPWYFLWDSSLKKWEPEKLTLA
jgi:protein tyrosine/serine phosphatase